MKTIKKIVFGAIVAVPMFLAPQQSKAGGLIGDLLGDLGIGGGSGNGGSCSCQSNPPSNPPAGNSVPIDGGTVLLLAAGLAFGTKVMYDRHKKQIENSLA
jgi:hypothetical protein